METTVFISRIGKNEKSRKKLSIFIVRVTKNNVEIQKKDLFAAAILPLGNGYNKHKINRMYSDIRTVPKCMMMEYELNVE